MDAGGEASSTVLEAPVSDPTTIAPVPGAPTEGIEELALDAHGATLAYGMDPGGIEVETASGTVLGTAPAEASSLAFSPDGTQLAFVRRREPRRGPGPGRVHLHHLGPPLLCQDADQVLSQFVGDQVAHDQAGLAALTASGAPPAGTLTPASVDRGYVISSELRGRQRGRRAHPHRLRPAHRRSDGHVPGQLTDETVVLGQSDGGWLVTGLSVPPLRTRAAVRTS